MPPSEPAGAPSTVAADHAARLDVSRLLTEPLTTFQISRYFRIGRHRVPELVSGMEGAERFGRKYRLPLCRMTPQYLLAARLLEPVQAPANWPERDGSATQPHVGLVSRR